MILIHKLSLSDRKEIRGKLRDSVSNYIDDLAECTTTLQVYHIEDKFNGFLHALTVTHLVEESTTEYYYHKFRKAYEDRLHFLQKAILNSTTDNLSDLPF